jgi:GNAT superfamily N-acetyltransferase
MAGVSAARRPDDSASSAVVIRPAGEADLAGIVELFELGAAPGTPAGVEDGAELDRYASALHEIEATGGTVLVAQLGEQVVGVCQLIVFRHLQRRGGRCAEIESVHVHPDHRSSGIGSALLRDAIERARRLGCYRVQLTSNVVRTDAHRFYERLGFVPSHVGFKLPMP